MAKRIAFTAILMALSVVTLFGASVLPTAKIAILAITSVFGAIVVAEYGAKYGAVHYIGVSILAFLLIPKKMMVIIYFIFLGYYPIVKMYIERINKRGAEWLIKLLIFNLFLVLAYFIFNAFFLPAMESVTVLIAVKYLPALIVVSEAIFVIYDYMLSYIIAYYYKVVRIKMNGGKFQ